MSAIAVSGDGFFPCSSVLVSRSRTTSDFDSLRRRDSASIWATRTSGNRTVKVFMERMYCTIGIAANG